MQPLYDPETVRPLRDELTMIGFEQLTTAEEVDRLLGRSQGTVLLVINSVCGCAAGSARPGVALALQHQTIPDRLATVFAGVDTEATARAREYMPQHPPSSPFIALFRDGKEVFVLERRHIEQMDVDSIAHILKRAFDEFCHKAGPSVPAEVYEESRRQARSGCRTAGNRAKG
jgi:putative YphP/YqiW family bacilliredoxin